ncbi:chaplin family protein [Streptomyces sp. NPDC047928]|uniref:chaplin n=1 Tax=unclassified Streptomyces TaxID=2593676 RepID=UPI00371E994D
MRHTRRNGLVALMATGGALALAAGSAHADADAAGAAADSPGVISGNTVQLPVDVPVNICGNTVNVVGLLNPAFGNKCANTGGSEGHRHKDRPGTPHGKPGDGKAGSGNTGGASAQSVGKDSPGVISGNGIQLPVDLPVNVSGNSVSFVGIGNPVFGNASSNSGGKPPTHVVTPPKPPVKDRTPGTPATPPKQDETAPPASEGSVPAPHGSVSLAETGAGDLAGLALPAAGLILGGALLYRRFRPASDAS